MTQARKGPGFFGLSLIALAGVGAMVGGLVLLRRQKAEAPAPLELPLPGSERSAAAPRAKEGTRQDAGVRTLRSVLPAEAWVVLDVDLSLLNAAGWANPNALRPLDCDRVSPPARLAVAVLPASSEAAGDAPWPAASGAPGKPAPIGVPAPSALAPRMGSRGVPDLVVAALGASPAFRDCAKRKLMRDEGTPRTLPGGFEVIENAVHTRLVSHAERDLLLFATASAPSTEELIAVVRGERPNAGSTAHDALGESLGSRALGITATLPPGWLERAGGGPEASESPLSQLRAAALGVRLDGTLEATLLCSQAGTVDGCTGLASFIVRAKGDILRGLPEERQRALERTFSLESRPRALHVSWRLEPSDVSALLAPLLADPSVEN